MWSTMWIELGGGLLSGSGKLIKTGVGQLLIGKITRPMPAISGSRVAWCKAAAASIVTGGAIQLTRARSCPRSRMVRAAPALTNQCCSWNGPPGHNFALAIPNRRA